MASPLVLLGCGGGGSSEPPEAPPPATTGPDPAAVAAAAARLPALDRAAVAVSVELPPGSGISAASSTLLTANNVSQIAADGTAGAVLTSGAPQMAYVVDGSGRLLLMGLIEPGVRTRVDARSTAEALVLVASLAALQGPALELATRETLRTHTLVEPVRLAVEAAATRNGIDQNDSALVDAVRTAVHTLTPPEPVPASAGRRQALGVEVFPAAAQSGIVIETTGDYNAIVVKNTFRRRAHVWLSRIGYFDASGNAVQLPAPVPLLDVPVSATTALSFDNLVVSVGDYLAEFTESIGFLGDYERGNGWWSPVTTDPLTLPVEPEAAAVAVYRARAVGIGANDGMPMTAAEAAKLEELLGATLWEDIALPLIKTLLLPMATQRVTQTYSDTFQSTVNSLLLAAAADLTKISVSGTYFPGTAAALRSGNANEVATQFLTEFFGSAFFTSLLETAMHALVQASGVSPSPAVRDGSGAIVAVNLLPEADRIAANVARLKAGLSRVARIVEVVQVVTMVADYAAMARDWSAANRVDEFTLNVSKARITLTPDPVVVVATAGVAGSAAITAQVEGLDGVVTPENVFLQWRCSGRYGDLIKRGGNGSNDFESVLTNATHDYIPTGTAADPALPDTIRVTAFYRNPTTNQRVEMGSVSVQVNFRDEFTLAVMPSAVQDVPADADFSLGAFVRETLPSGATVQWTWSHGGVGAIDAPVVDANPQDSAVIFHAGSTEGAAQATVEAQVSLPATDTSAARTVRLQPATIQLRVRRGLQTVTVSGAYTTEVLATDPGRVNVTAYFVVPRVGNATGYAVSADGFNDFAYYGDSYATSFAVPPSGSGPQARGGGWWIGLSGADGPDSRTGDFVGWMNARFASARVTAVVTLRS